MVKFLILSFCFFLLVRWLLKPIIKMVINSMLNKMVQNGGAPKSQPNRPFGSINVDQDAPAGNSKRSKNSNEGEYVDYEEIR